MSDNSEKKYTEKDAILLKRQAYMEGMSMMPSFVTLTPDTLQREAKRRFPLPRVTRPRVVTENPFGLEYRAVRRPDGLLVIERRLAHSAEKWSEPNLTLDPARVKFLAELLATPDETVEDDA